MRTRTLLPLLFLAAAVTSSGQESAVATPDYSRGGLLRILADVERPEREPAVKYHIGAVEFRALGTQWRFVYLPLMMPLSGTAFRTSSQLPDPFALTGTPYATPPRLWRTQRAVSQELRRIDRLTNGKIKATIKIGED